MKQANAIVDGGFDNPTFDFPSSVASETRKIALAAKGKESPQEPRSALGCKRAPFSSKPDLWNCCYADTSFSQQCPFLEFI